MTLIHRHRNLTAIVWTTAVLLFSLFLSFIPLFDLLGFEFAAATGVIFFLAQGSLAIRRIGDYRRRLVATGSRETVETCRGFKNITPRDETRTRIGRREIPLGASGVVVAFSLFFSGFPVLLLHVAISLAVILLNMARVPNCDPGEGLIFYALIPVVSGMLGNAWGLLAGLATGSRLKAHLILLLFAVVSAAHSLYYLLFQPGTFTTSAIIGLFPGPVYEEALSISLPLVLARVMTLSGTAAILLLTALTLDPERGRSTLFPPGGKRMDSATDGTRRQCFGFFLSTLMLLGLGYGYKGDLGTATSRRYLHSRLDGLLRTVHFDIRYEKNSPVAADLELVAADHEFRFHQVTAFLDVTFGKRITSYIYSSPRQKKRLIGAGRTMIGDPMNLEMHLNYGRFPIPVLKHELTHVISSAFGLPLVGVGRNVGLMEGVAEAVEWDGGDLTPHQRCTVMARLSLLPDVRKLMGGFNLWAESAATSYPACGSFVRFLTDRYGARRLKEVYSSGRFGDVYGKNIDHLVNEWEGFIEGITLPETDLAAEEHRLRRPPIFSRVCARKIASIREKGDGFFSRRWFAAAASLYNDAYELNVEDPNVLWRLARAQYCADDLEGAGESALLLESHSHSIPLHTIFARNLRANIYWRTGNYERALEIYRDIYSRRLDSGWDARLWLKIQVSKHEELREMLREVVNRPHVDAEGVLLLQKAAWGHPDFAPVFFLLGEKLYEEGSFSRSAGYFRRAWEIGVENTSVALDCLESWGAAMFRTGDIEGAREVFRTALGVTGIPEGRKVSFLDWIERCAWSRKDDIPE